MNVMVEITTTARTIFSNPVMVFITVLALYNIIVNVFIGEDEAGLEDE